MLCFRYATKVRNVNTFLGNEVTLTSTPYLLLQVHYIYRSLDLVRVGSESQARTLDLGMTTHAREP
jgi:hypothetical protein